MSLDATLDATVGTAADGEATFTFEVENSGSEPVELTFRSGKRIDVVVTDTTGTEVWRWSDGRMFTQAITSVELGPGETFDETVSWRDPPGGSYEATATLETTQSVSATTSLSV